MAVLHRATVTPTKLELVTPWLHTRAWFTRPSDVRPVGAYRFDDPDGEVGIETFVLEAADGTTVQAPLTYRSAPLTGADAHLIGTADHSVLGERWVYDGCADPVWAAAALTAILTGGRQATELVDTPEGLVAREPTATVVGSGTPGTPVPGVDAVTCHDEGPTTVVRAGGLELVVHRVLGDAAASPHTLTGRWATGGPTVLIDVRPTEA